MAASAAASIIARRSAGSSRTALRVTCSGARQGKPGARTLCVAGDYYRVSGLVMAAAVRELLAKDWEPGVYTPVQVLDHPAVYAWMRRAGLRFMIGEERGQAGTGDAGIWAG
jgi:hypothetical protein